MRIVERIELFLDKINVSNLLNNIWKIDFPGKEASITTIVEDIENGLLDERWKDCPDWRFSQVLINNGYIPNIPGIWYYMEEPEILVQQGEEISEVYFWGQNYDKDMNLLPKTIYRPIKELSTEHIQAILDGRHTPENGLYWRIFRKVLRDRGVPNALLG